MKKLLLMVGGIVLVLILAVGIGAGFFLGNIVKATVNRVGPQVTQSNVVLADAQLSPFTGTGTFTGLSVGNPEGWSKGQAFAFNQVHVDLEPTSLFKDTIVINELVIEKPEFNYETTLLSSNIQALLKNIEAYTGKGSETADKDASAKKFIVKKLRFTNGKATVVVAGTALPLPLPEIKLDDIGTAEGGISGAKVAIIVMRDVLTNVVTAATAEISKDGGKATLEKAKETGKQLEDAVKGLFKK